MDTALGASAGWPATLRSTVDLALACSFPMLVLWGADLTQIYNDAYASIMGTRHPLGMGQCASDCWPELQSFNEPLFESVFAGETRSIHDQPFTFNRDGLLSESFFSFCYSPLRDEVGEVQGILVSVSETTGQRKADEVRFENERITSQALGDARSELRALSHHLMTAQEDEGRRIARNLHDDIGQRVALLGFKTDALGAHVDPDGRITLAALRTEIGELSSNLRNISHQLHPSIIGDLGLRVALQALVVEFRKHGLQVQATTEEVPQLPIEVSTALYRIAQEALRNVQKHAPTATVEVRLWRKAGSLHLIIRDRGLGFCLADLEVGSGLGLVSMQERARNIGGVMLLTSQPGKGTTVLVRVDFPESAKDDATPNRPGRGQPAIPGRDPKSPLFAL